MTIRRQVKSVSVARAKARLSEVLDLAESGGEIVITRRGQPVARLTGVTRPRKPIDFESMDALRARQPAQGRGSAALLRRIRDDAY